VGGKGWKVSTQLAVYENVALERAEVWDEDRTALLKRTICRGASDDELALFVETCARTGLNPFMRQVHAVKRWDAREKREVMSIQVGIDGFRLIAERTGRYVPGREPTFATDDKGKVLSATAYVKKLVANEWHEIAATAWYEEYVQLTRDGAPNSMWARMPRTMLAKVAESLALRRAFPADMSGLYSPEEMGQADVPAPAPMPAQRAEKPAQTEWLPPDKKCEERRCNTPKIEGERWCETHRQIAKQLAAANAEVDAALPPPTVQTPAGTVDTSTGEVVKPVEDVAAKRARAEGGLYSLLAEMDAEGYSLGNLGLTDEHAALMQFLLGAEAEMWAEIPLDELSLEELKARGRELRDAITRAREAKAAPTDPFAGEG
jgi:phage recombination protein Bet